MNDDEDSDYHPHKSSRGRLIKMWKRVAKLLIMFWKSWREDYIQSLRECTHMSLKSGRINTTFQAQVGDVVVIEELLLRCCWRIAKITIRFELLKFRRYIFQKLLLA